MKHMQRINEWDSKHFDKYLDDEENDRVYDLVKKLESDINTEMQHLYAHYKETLSGKDDRDIKNYFIQAVMESLSKIKK